MCVGILIVNMIFSWEFIFPKISGDLFYQTFYFDILASRSDFTFLNNWKIAIYFQELKYFAGFDWPLSRGRSWAKGAAATLTLAWGPVGAVSFLSARNLFNPLTWIRVLVNYIGQTTLFYLTDTPWLYFVPLEYDWRR